MAHQEQKDFFNKVKAKFPFNFKRVCVVDFGSLDVNGSLKELFENSKYIGVDIHLGKNVNILCKASEFTSPSIIDTIVSGEMLEHDESWKESLLNMYSLLRSDGLMVVTAAGPKRAEHGTGNADDPWIWGTRPDYYKNISFQMVMDFLKDLDVKEFHFEYGRDKEDSYFYLIK